MGWRYLLFCLGGITLFLWGLRFFTFKLLESPRYLVGIGQDADAVAVIHQLAAYNSTNCDLTVEKLAYIPGPTCGATRRIMSESSKFSFKHIKALFVTPKMAWSTCLLISLWGAQIVRFSIVAAVDSASIILHPRYHWISINFVQQFLAIPVSPWTSFIDKTDHQPLVFQSD
jgi:hypothetical protein